jgi:hypothetical protein
LISTPIYTSKRSVKVIFIPQLYTFGEDDA